jgi:hypothetical protein
MALDKIPDAILVPPGRLKGGIGDRVGRLKEVFGIPFWGGRNIAAATVYGRQLNFVTPAPQETSLCYPHEHPLHGQERYTWYVAARDKSGEWHVLDQPARNALDAADQIKFGYLKPDPYADGATPEDEQESAVAELIKRANAKAAVASAGTSPAFAPGSPESVVTDPKAGLDEIDLNRPEDWQGPV